MKNYMKEVANMFGVEIGEEFEIIFPDTSTCHATAMFTNEGVKVVNTNVYDVCNLKAYALTHLLNGNYDIKRKPWKPKFEEKYFSIGVDGTVEDGVWLNDFLDYSLYKIGNCYRTIDEARANRSKWGAFYDSNEVLKV